MNKLFIAGIKSVIHFEETLFEIGLELDYEDYKKKL